jgi:methionyl-tRNA synthetase
MATFDKASIDYDHVHDCDSNFHLGFVESFVDTMLDKGLLRIAPHTSLICDACRHEVFEAFAAGECPYCGSTSNGCVCEDCGNPNNSYDLRGVHCNLCGGPTRSVTVNKAIVDMAACRGHQNGAGFSITAPAKLARYLAGQADLPMAEYVASFYSDWGLTSTRRELNEQVYLVWLEMAAGYLAALYKGVFDEECTDVKWAIERLNAADYEVIHFMGFDNSFYYASLYPKIFAALGLRGLNITFAVNEFLLLEQSKFSTSRNHAIWAKDAFTSSETADWYRFYLSINKPETARQNFAQAEFDAFVADTRQQFECIVSKGRQRLGAAWSGDSPEAGSWLPVHRHYADFFDALERYLEQSLSVPTCYSVKTYATGVKHLLDVLTQFQAATALEDRGDAGTRRTTVAIERRAIDMLRRYLGTIMPAASAALSARAKD